MRAITITNPGPEGTLTLSDITRPEPKAGQVLIHVAYAGVNRADSLQKQGSYAPPEGASPLPGLEVSGTITALGDGVSGWSLGEKVCALLSGGGYAEYVVADAALTLPIPAGLSLKEAASLPEAAATGWMALVGEARLKAGERVLIHGGASNIGVILVQIARVLGAEVFATAGTPEKCALLASLGVTALLNTCSLSGEEQYRKDIAALNDSNASNAPFDDLIRAKTNGQGVDVIIDILGAPYLARHFKLLRRGGRLVSLAFLDGNEVNHLKISSLLTRQLTWSGTMLRNRASTEKAAYIAAVRAHLWPFFVRGEMRPVIDSVFALERAEKAHKRMEERLHCGKILLEVAPHKNMRD